MRRTEGSRLLLRQPRVRIMALCKVPKGTVARWCSGVRIPEERYRVLLVQVGIPLEAWGKSTYPGLDARCGLTPQPAPRVAVSVATSTREVSTMSRDVMPLSGKPRDLLALHDR